MRIVILALLALVLIAGRCPQNNSHDHAAAPVECSGLALMCGTQTACDVLPMLTCDLADKYNLHHDADWPCDCEER